MEEDAEGKREFDIALERLQELLKLIDNYDISGLVGIVQSGNFEFQMDDDSSQESDREVKDGLVSKFLKLDKDKIGLLQCLQAFCHCDEIFDEAIRQFEKGVSIKDVIKEYKEARFAHLSTLRK